MFWSLVLRRTLLVAVPVISIAVIAWALSGFWVFVVILAVAAGAMMVRGLTLLRRART